MVKNNTGVNVTSFIRPQCFTPDLNPGRGCYVHDTLPSFIAPANRASMVIDSLLNAPLYNTNTVVLKAKEPQAIFMQILLWSAT